MRDGVVILRVEHGQVVAVLQNAGLDRIYERMFRKAYRRARRSQDSVEAGINVAVFGAFWLESSANKFLRDALALEAHSEMFGNALWMALRRAPLLEKLELFHALAKNDLVGQFTSVKSGVRTLLDLRNRLAHFKDDDTVVSGPVPNISDAVRIMSLAEDPDLITHLRAPTVLAYGQAVQKAYRWMSRVHSLLRKSHGLQVKRHRPSHQPSGPLNPESHDTP